jgi:hypothetical protein
VGDAGISSLAKALRHNTTLTSLDLRSNEVGDGGVARLADALEHNTSLVFLDLCDNPAGDQELTRIASSLRLNKRIQDFQKAQWKPSNHRSYPPKFGRVVKALLIARQVECNQPALSIADIPMELMCWITELLAADPIFWLERKE